MDNVFLQEAFYWSKQNPLSFRIMNKVLGRLRVPFRLRPTPDPMRDMTTLEMRINLFHLVEQVCAHEVEGHLAEFGSFTGETAALFGEVAQAHAPDKELHVYDTFETKYRTEEAVRPQLEANLRSRGLRNWTVHQGNFYETVPKEVPEKLCFVHIDCGSGGGDKAREGHRKVVTHLLESVYPRLAEGGIIALMDYCDPGRLKAYTPNPGVRDASDAFFADKPEKVNVLIAGDFGLGYIRKAARTTNGHSM